MRDKKKIVIGMSGGVDSSVAAYLLKSEGYEVIGVTLDHNEEKSLKIEIAGAKEICDLLGIKHIIVDIQELFRKEVIENFLDGYSNGITPSPCVICDERVKLKTLFKIADEENAEYVATGHYCSVEYLDEFESYLLKVSINKRKDQSYMLYRLDRDKIERLKFPLYNYEKSEIREIAKNIGLKVHDKGDSQGICFAKNGYIDFLRENLRDKIKKGKFLNKDGKVLGEHQGYQLYTIGQRRGLGLKLPKPHFIVNIKKESNEIILGDYKELYKKEVKLLEFKSPVELDKLIGKKLIGRPRFSSFGDLGEIKIKDNEVFFEFDESTPQLAPGQHLVLYYEDFVLGGGIIET